MNLDEIDKYCDQFERELKQNPKLKPKDFCGRQDLPESDELMTELNRVAADYSQAKDEPASTAGMPESTQIGGTIGPYKLLQQIGEGGMGTVYMAEQEMPVQRRVALKVIKPGMGSKEVVARFESERQALALMDHENIAKMFDAGTTVDGRPYFVMELVRGVPLTKFCDDNKLSIKERLELFISVCQAVQHAHQKGIIHRDIKPSNVLVSNYDGRPVPKVIDFGVAKAMQQKLTDKTLFTEFGRVIGTLQYMSPEQAGLSQLDIDTRSDIYSLGVLLYELLTGSTPVDKQRIREVGWERIMQVIREEEPPKPSTKISESGDTLADISAQRHSNPNSLGSLVRGDLDWIVMKSLEKDRSRRYETANGLARDIERHLAGEIVEARPPSWSYRASRFVRKNRIAIGVTGTISALLIVGVTLLTWLAIWAMRAEQNSAKSLDAERDASRQTRMALDTLTDDVIQNVFSQLPELGSREKQYLRKVVELYDELSSKNDASLESRLANAEGHFRVAEIRRNLSEFDPSLDGYREAIRQLNKIINDIESSPNIVAEPGAVSISDVNLVLATTRVNYGLLLAHLNKSPEAESEFREAVEILEQLDTEEPEIRNNLALALSNLGLVSQRSHIRDSSFRRAIEIREGLVAESEARDKDQYKRNLAHTYFSLAKSKHQNQKINEAEPAYQRGIELYEELSDEFQNQPSIAEGMAGAYVNYSNFLADTNRPGAEEFLRKGLRIQSILASRYPVVSRYQSSLVGAHVNLGILLQEFGKRKTAQKELETAVKIASQLVSNFPEVSEYQVASGFASGNLGKFHWRVGNYAQAIQEINHAVARYKTASQIAPPDAIDLRNRLDFQQNLGKIQWSQNQFEEAEKNLLECLALLDTPEVKKNQTTIFRFQKLSILNDLQMNLQSQKKLVKAKQAGLEAISLEDELKDSQMGSTPMMLGLFARVHNNHALTLGYLDELTEAEVHYRKAIQFQSKLADGAPSAPIFRVDLAGSYVNFGGLLMKKGNFNEALDYCDDAINILQRVLEKDPDYVVARRFFSNAKKSRSNVERKIEKLEQIPIMLKSMPKLTAEQLVEVMALCHLQKRYSDSVQLFENAIKVDESLADIPPLRYNAACAASAAANEGNHGKEIDLTEKAALREKAIKWLRADLKLHGGNLEGEDEKMRDQIVGFLKLWKDDSDLSGIRDDEATQNLPEEQLEKIRELWDAYDKVISDY